MGWRNNDDGSTWFGGGGMPDWDKDAEDDTYKPFSPLVNLAEQSEEDREAEGQEKGWW